jgi:hypothetical protein
MATHELHNVLRGDILGDLGKKARRDADNNDFVSAISEINHALAAVNVLTTKITRQTNNRDYQDWTIAEAKRAIAKQRAIIATGCINEPGIPAPYYYQGYAYIATKIAEQNPEKEKLIAELIIESGKETGDYLQLIDTESDPRMVTTEFHNHLSPLSAACLRIANTPHALPQTQEMAIQIVDNIKMIESNPHLIHRVDLF